MVCNEAVPFITLSDLFKAIELYVVSYAKYKLGFQACVYIQIHLY